MNRSVRRLRCFMALADTLNFRRAAQDLAMSQPALSRAVAQLELEVGVRLFDRDRSFVRLTEAGARFREGCARAVAELDRSAREAVLVAKGEAGSLDVGYTDIAISGRLTTLVRAFCAAADGVVLSLRQACTEHQYALLRTGEIDIGFLTGPPQGEAFDHALIQSDPLAVVLPAGHPLADQAEIDLHDLARQPFVSGLESTWRVFHNLVDRLCAEAGFTPNVIQRAPDTQGIAGLVACGMGVSIQATGLGVLDDPRLRVRPLRDCRATVDTYAVWKRDGLRRVATRFVAQVTST